MAFLAHLVSIAVAQQPAPAPTAEELMKKLDGAQGLADKEKPFEIAASLARLYVSQGRMAEAVGFAKDALKAAEPALQWYLEQKKLLGSAQALAENCEPSGTEPNLGVSFAAAQKHAQAKRVAQAVGCLRKALSPVSDVLILDGNAKFLTKDVVGAKASYERAIAVFPELPEPYYSRGALTLDEKPDEVRALETAKADLQRFLSLAPSSPKAANAQRLLKRAEAGIAAGGLTKIAKAPAPSSMPPPLSQATIDAFQNAPRTPESDQRFAKLIEDAEAALAQGEFQKALDGFKQVMPFQPENARLRAGMAWSLVKLGKPMADNVWRVASQSPEALDALGDRLKEKGDAQQAKALWSRLAETVPAYAPKLEGKR
jgi:tetratricopeptide (TPR) repeat protein